jgi:hypothetical protein
MRRALILAALLVAACAGERPAPPAAERSPATLSRPLPAAALPAFIIPERFVEKPRPRRKPPAARSTPPLYRGAPAAAAVPAPPRAVETPIAPVVVLPAPPPPDPGLPASEIAPVAGEPDPMLVPAPARPYQRTMLRESRAVWGMSAPTALFGAQIQAESAWRPAAHSIYAAGLAQFIPSTAEAMSRRYPELGGAAPLNPSWAIRGLVRYDRDIYKGRFVNAVPPASECDRWAFVLSGYNGGEGWIAKDRALCRERAGCDPSRWFGHVERYTSRSASNARENREYPKRIELQYQSIFRSWGGAVSCRA